jgi:uncharacterized protein (TIGR00290 family)
MKQTLLAWSSGKDSAWSLYRLRKTNEYQVVALLTSFNSVADRVAMHAVRRSLVRQQAQAAGLPLWEVELPWPCSNQQYESAMARACERAVQSGIECVAFGDLFLRDIREYREKQLQGTGLQPIFPLWSLPTEALAKEMIAAGLRARITCVDTRQLAPEFAGREFDARFLEDLPHPIDRCGENGEFHSFVYAGPMFSRGIEVETGEAILRDGFMFCDLVGQPKDALV